MSDLPFVSVIIPVCNDCVGIQQTLRSLFIQAYPKNRYEIIVVDNNSADGTFSTIQKTASEFDGTIIVETEKTSGSYAARNRGIHVSKGKILAFIDSNMTVDPGWLNKSIVCISNHQADYVGCRIEIIPSRKRASLWEKYHMALGFPVNDYMQIDGYAPTACLILKRHVLETAGDFDTRLVSGGDCEFGARVRDHGFKMIYDPENVMYHPARNSFSSLIQKEKRVTLGQIRIRRLFPERYPHNQLSDITVFCIQLLPVANPSVIRKLLTNPGSFFPLFGIFYLLRLYICWLKFSNKCIF